MGIMRYGVEGALVCVCLILHAKCTLLNTAERNHHVQGDNGNQVVGPLERKHLETKKKVKNSKQKKHQIPPWLGNVYGKLEYSSYVTDAFAKKSDITPPDVVASKRTIKIGNQVCGSGKEAKRIDGRWDDKRSVNEEDTKVSNDDPEIIAQVHLCCAEHNRCPRSVPAKSTKYGFTNDIEYAIMSCKCDNTFRRCLKEVKSYTADAIGHLYFDALKIPCLTFYDESNEGPHRNYDMISVVPDVAIPHPKIGGAQVILKPNEGKEQKDGYFYTHEQEGVADSKEKGRQSSHPQLVRSVQYPTPKLPAVTSKIVNRSEKTTQE